MDYCAALGLRACFKPGRLCMQIALCTWHSVFRESPIACHAEAVGEGRSILYCRFCRGSLSFPRPLLSDAPFTHNGCGFLFFPRLPGFFAFLAKLSLIQISSEPLVSKTAAEAGSSNCQCSRDLNRPAARSHVPRTFVQRIFIGKREPASRCIALTRHNWLFR
jgi:hypothetical protein